MSSSITKYKFAGFGGQGVLFIGKVMAQAGMLAKQQVTWFPAYGPEMRGGTAGREDIRFVRVPVNEIAHEIGEAQVANIVMLGVMQAITPSLSDDVLEQALMELAGKKPELAELNMRALNAGREYAKNL